jgi:Photosynthetic reaction centre cytochrome C subunit
MRRILISLFLAVPFLLLAAAPQDPPQKKGMPAPKNLKVLPADVDIRATMGAFRTALGQQCTFCHVQGDFASDENPKKEVARHMIQMVNEINAKFPDGKVHVSCYTCHRGATTPLMTPPAQ